MHPDLQTYNLSGMGCSAGLISIALARELLENNSGKTCLVISTEIITQQLYDGNDRAYLVQNTLFRYVSDYISTRHSALLRSETCVNLDMLFCSAHLHSNLTSFRG